MDINAKNSKKRGRPLGSKNHIKSNAGVFNLNFEKQIEGSPVTKKNSLGWVNWGTKNNYPNLLLELYQNSPTHRAAINFGVQSIVGNGVDLEAMKLKDTEVVPSYGNTWDNFMRSVALDYMLYGSYAIQVIMNNDKKTYSFYHVPLEKVRWTPYDEDGNITGYYISNDWTSIGLNPPLFIDALDFTDDEVVEMGKPYLYVYRSYSPTQTYYTSPHYAAAIKPIQAEIEFINYDLKSVINGFTPTGIITLPEVETDEQRQAILDNVQRMFQGSDNANSVMVTFRNSIEEKAAEYTPFATNNGNVDLYEASNDRTIDRILAAHQIPSKSLIGLNNKKTGFNSEGAFLESAYNLYNTLTGNYNRNCIVRTMNQIFRMNGIDTEIILKPLVFKLEDDYRPQGSNDNDSENVNEDNNDKSGKNKVEPTNDNE